MTGIILTFNELSDYPNTFHLLTNKQKIVIILAVLLAMLSFSYISSFFNYLHNSTEEYSFIVSITMNYIGYIIVELYRETVSNIFNFCSTFLN